MMEPSTGHLHPALPAAGLGEFHKVIPPEGVCGEREIQGEAVVGWLEKEGIGIHVPCSP